MERKIAEEVFRKDDPTMGGSIFGATVECNAVHASVSSPRMDRGSVETLLAESSMVCDNSRGEGSASGAKGRHGGLFQTLIAEEDDQHALRSGEGAVSLRWGGIGGIEGGFSVSFFMVEGGIMFCGDGECAKWHIIGRLMAGRGFGEVRGRMGGGRAVAPQGDKGSLA